ncbi:GNAT family N-acetyltransferase [Niabella drilacis]|uniref:Ribosomal protein S18 acetylase RimI n=1 Tax=Niabella drilacis (strain DSM 25811 / CCM 8410 / CCUG 62505 / LMG 26954 / E90) TaxID=1285928 RepID=A0A1G6KZQ0_NIADE|nr:GNAT family N-acetyltransferase [Niabella drilacis]SDC36423.1 Ribosomal protein S18 acetylase RimI [Niabella drilacis]
MKINPVIVTLKNNVTITIRAALKTDAEGLLEAGWRYLQESPYLITSLNEFNYTRPQEQAWIRSLNESDNSLLLVAVSGNRIIGNLQLSGESRSKIRHNALLGIAVRKQWQEIGLGTALIRTAIDWARARGILKNIWLHVHATNGRAIALYKKTGFIETGRQPEYIRDPNGGYTDNILMGLFLRP